jgi:bifunctional non-homologous end joining protein LigD
VGGGPWAAGPRPPAIHRSAGALHGGWARGARCDRPFDDPAYLFEPKYDGFRGLLYLNGRECRFRSKRGNVLRRFEQLCYWVREELPERDMILDGEVVSLDKEGRQDFRALMSGRGNLHYAAFDVLWLNGNDLRGQDLARRKRILKRLIPQTSTVLSQVFTVQGRGRDLLAAVERLDLEGIVAKRLRDPYTPDESRPCYPDNPRWRHRLRGFVHVLSRRFPAVWQGSWQHRASTSPHLAPWRSAPSGSRSSVSSLKGP